VLSSAPLCCVEGTRDWSLDTRGALVARRSWRAWKHSVDTTTTTTTPASGNIFRTMYFARADGVYRNVLGQAVKDDDEDDFGGSKRA